MSKPSPRSHLYRLGLVLVIAIAGFLVIKSVATPPSWNYKSWYRGGAIGLAEKQPLIYGGNESCVSCHAKASAKVKKLKHKALSCESCHGALGDHAKGKKKIAAAKVDKSKWQCLNCHSQQINRPRRFPQFTNDVRKHRNIEKGVVCLKCHDAHDPTP